MVSYVHLCDTTCWDATTEPHELVEQFVDVVEYLNRQVRSDHLEEWQGLEMTIPQVKTMVLLGVVGPSRMGTISVHLGSALSATTNIVDRLVERGLVERVADASDRRVVICRLTSQGQEATDRFWRVGRERLLAVVEVLDQEQLALAVRGLETLRDAQETIQDRLSSTEAPG